MNKYILKNIDCRQVLKEISTESIDLIVTDPPYKVTSRGNSGSSGGMCKKKINKSGQVFEYNNIDCSEYASEMFRILKNNSHCYIMTNHINLLHFLTVFTDCGFKFIKCLIWNKVNKIMCPYYMSQFEYILFFRKGAAKQINNCDVSDILTVPNKKTKDEFGNNLHDTEKPVELMRILIENSSEVNDVVLDPFMGIGSTGVACRLINRDFIGCEIDNKYFEIAKSRILNTKIQSSKKKVV